MYTISPSFPHCPRWYNYSRIQDTSSPHKLIQWSVLFHSKYQNNNSLTFSHHSGSLFPVPRWPAKEAKCVVPALDGVKQALGFSPHFSSLGIFWKPGLLRRGFLFPCIVSIFIYYHISPQVWVSNTKGLSLCVCMLNSNNDHDNKLYLYGSFSKTDYKAPLKVQKHTKI